MLDLTEQMLLQFGFDKYEVNLSTRPEKAVGDDEIWMKATGALKDALTDKGWAYEVDEGGGAFYGPKIDLKIEDALGRKWQCSTIQVSFGERQFKKVKVKVKVIRLFVFEFCRLTLTCHNVLTSHISIQIRRERGRS